MQYVFGKLCKVYSGTGVNCAHSAVVRAAVECVLLAGRPVCLVLGAGRGIGYSVARLWAAKDHQEPCRSIINNKPNLIVSKFILGTTKSA